MRELLGKIGRFCESHVEKLVLVVVGLFCAWLFFTWVIFSPNVVVIDGKPFSPGQVDEYVRQQADDLAGMLGASGPATSGQTNYVTIMDGPIPADDVMLTEVFATRPPPKSFSSLFNSPLAYLGDSSVGTGQAARVREQPNYDLPRVGEVTEVAVNYIRAAAYLPTVPIDAKNPYHNADVEPNDIDLVTVEAKFDVENLYRQFKAYFDGTEVERPEWRDPCLAEPVFAAVQVQRQTLQANGLWSDWAALGRCRVDSNKELLTVVEKVGDLPPGGLGVRLMQYDNPLIAMELLQPSGYQIASAEEDWFPPSYYEQFKSEQRKVESEERRKEREDLQDQRDRDTTNRGGRRDTTRGNARDRSAAGARRGSGTTAAAGAYGGTATGTRSRSRDRTATGTTTNQRRSNRRGGPTTPGGAYNEDMGMGPYGGIPGDLDQRQMASTDKIYMDFAENMITYATDMSRLKDPVLVWGFDDTTKPGGTYRYRLRVGVFNPVAGTGKVSERDADKKDQVILWSDFSGVTEAVEIPKRLYFFAKTVQEPTRTATVEVARYTLGYWRTEDFQVRLGEVIGKEMEPKEEEEDRAAARQRAANRNLPGRAPADMGMGAGVGMVTGPVGLGVSPRLARGDERGVVRPDMIDYRTNAVLIDLVQVNDLAGPQFRPRGYHDMLYTDDGITIKHMPVSSGNWPADMRSIYQQIKSEERREQQPFRAFGKGIRSRVGTGMESGGASPYGSPYGGGYSY